MDTEPEGEGWIIGHISDEDFSSDAIIQGVQLLRSKAPNGSLRPIDTDVLQSIIHEFYVIVMRGEFVGCFRIFKPVSLGGKVLELGSVVSTKAGVGGFIALKAKNIAIEERLPIIAVTQGRFANILKHRGWKVRKRKYELRRSESCKSKVLLEYKP